MTNKYKDLVFFTSKPEKKLDKTEDLSYTTKTDPELELNLDYKAYAIVKLGSKKYAVAVIEFDSKQQKSTQTVDMSNVYESEMRALKEVQNGLKEAALVFRKQNFSEEGKDE